MTPDAIGKVYFCITTRSAQTATKIFTLQIHGGTTGGQKLNICAVNAANQFLPGVPLNNYLVEQKLLPAGRFVFLRDSAQRPQGGQYTQISGFIVQDASGGKQPSCLSRRSARFYGTPESPAETHSADGRSRQGDRADQPEYLWSWHKVMNAITTISISSCGGGAAIAATRYNWEAGNFWNAARDWQFRNGNYNHTSAQDKEPSGAADQANCNGAKANGTDAYITHSDDGLGCQRRQQRQRLRKCPDMRPEPRYFTRLRSDCGL